MAVLEVLKPPSQRAIEIRADGFHTAALAAAGLLANGLFELLQAFGSRPLHAPFKMVAQEVEPPGLAGVHQPGFVRVQAEAVGLYPTADGVEGRLSFGLAAA